MGFSPLEQPSFGIVSKFFVLWQNYIFVGPWTPKFEQVCLFPVRAKLNCAMRLGLGPKKAKNISAFKSCRFLWELSIVALCYPP